MSLITGKNILMTLSEIIKNKSLPSFCTSNLIIIEMLIKFCKKNKLPLLVETTSNQVNQYGGYSKNKPGQFYKKISSLLRKEKFNLKNFFYGGDHLGPLPWKNLNSKTALKNSIKLVDSYLNANSSKIHIDTSIKCADDKQLTNEIIFNRSVHIIKNLKYKKKLKKVFLVFGTEVPLSGGNDKSKIKKTSLNQVKKEGLNFKKLKKINLNTLSFALVIEPGMKFMHNQVTVPDFKNFADHKKFSKKLDFVFEAHSSDYQKTTTLKKVVKNNFKFLKVGPELTYFLLKAFFCMEKLENKFTFKNKSKFKKNLLKEMFKNKKYWKNYYKSSDKKIATKIMNSMYDRTRYYFETQAVKSSLKILKKNIEKIDQQKIIQSLIKNKNLKDYKMLIPYKLKNYELVIFCFVEKIFLKYYQASGFKTN